MFSRARAFTLLEVIIAVTVAIVLSTVAMQFLMSARKQAFEARVQAEMARDAHLVMDLFGYDMLYLGAGVPLDVCGDGGEPCAGNDMLPTVRRAHAQSIAFFGDLPLPNTEVNGVMNLVEVVDEAANQGQLIKVTSELSGACTPPSAAAAGGNRDCDTRLFSSLGVDPLSTNRCRQGATTERTCPWGLNKWQPHGGGVTAFQAVDGQSEWRERFHSGNFSAVGDGQIQIGGRKLRLDLTGAGGGVVLPDTLGGVGAYVTTIDRVFWAFEESGSPGTPCAADCVVFRNQCWGAMLDPDGGADVPDWQNGGFATNALVQGCAGLDGTGWELVATGLTDAQIFYRINSGWVQAVANETEASEIRAIRLEITLSRRSPAGVEMTQSYRRAYYLDNRDGP